MAADLCVLVQVDLVSAHDHEEFGAQAAQLQVPLHLRRAGARVSDQLPAPAPLSRRLLEGRHPLVPFR